GGGEGRTRDRVAGLSGSGADAGWQEVREAPAPGSVVRFSKNLGSGVFPTADGHSPMESHKSEKNLRMKWISQKSWRPALDKCRSRTGARSIGFMELELPRCERWWKVRCRRRSRQ